MLACRSEVVDVNVNMQLQGIGYEGVLQSMTASFLGGDMVGIIGPNGAGKSTLLRVMAGMWHATQGVITVNGDPVTRINARQRARKIAFMPQELSEGIGFTVAEFIEMGLYAQRTKMGSLPREARDQVSDAIEVFNLQPHAAMPLMKLSGGERQRVAVARCLAQGSPIILLDEPIANLDLHYQIEILETLSDLAKNGHLVILSIHNLELAAQYCTTLCLLSHGTLVAHGAPNKVLTEKAIDQVFHVSARIYLDPFTDALRLSYGREAMQDEGSNVAQH